MRRRTSHGFFGAALVVGLFACGAKTTLSIELARKDGGVPPVDATPPTDAETPPDAPRPTDGGPLPEPCEPTGAAPRCVSLHPGDPDRPVELAVVARITAADVLFLVDVTTSMEPMLERMRVELADGIVAELQTLVPELRAGLAEFSDYPEEPYGRFGVDVPFALRQAMTTDRAALRAAARTLAVRDGMDYPESQLEALYQAATGEGREPEVPPARCPAGTFGYPCFRATGTPVILLFTDSLIRGGPGNEEDAVRSYRVTKRELNELGARVLGFYNGSFDRESTLEQLRTIARDTRAVTAADEPLVFDIGPRTAPFADHVVEGVRRLLQDTPMEVSVEPEACLVGGLDVSSLVTRIETTGAEPRHAAEDLGDRYSAVRPGTRLGFRAWLRAEEGVTYPERLGLTFVFRDGEGATRLAEERIEVRVGGTCP